MTVFWGTGFVVPLLRTRAVNKKSGWGRGLAVCGHVPEYMSTVGCHRVDMDAVDSVLVPICGHLPVVGQGGKGGWGGGGDQGRPTPSVLLTALLRTAL